MLYFIRHGQSEANVRGVLAGQRDNSLLTGIGRKQALAAAKKLISDTISVDRIIASPLTRSIETATIIASELGFDMKAIIIDRRIIEYDMGSLSGTPVKDISSRTLVSAEGAEDPHSFKERVLSCLREYFPMPGNTLFVSHAGVGRIIETIEKNMEPQYFYDLPSWPNGTVMKIDWIK